MSNGIRIALAGLLLAVACKQGADAGTSKPATPAAATAPAAAAAPVVETGAAKPQDGKSIKVGVLTDMSGTYSDVAGKGSVAAAQMAIDDMGGKVGDKPITMVSADHQNKPDIASNTARKWIDEDNVDVIVDLVASSTALAVMPVAKSKNRITLPSGPASSRITNEACTDLNVHWAYDTYSLAVGTGREIVKSGGDSWFFITADYAFGHSLEADATIQIKAGGGKVLGSVNAPFPTSDFSSFLLQAKSSGAKVIGLANAGTDAVNSIKQAHEFGIVPNQQLAGLLVFISDLHSLGLPAAKGLLISNSFYWDRDDDTRKWSQRYFEKMHSMPTMVHAGVYSSLMHYFKAIQAAGTTESYAVMKKMKETPVNDFFSKNGHIREDGLHVHDTYLYQVKDPAESKGEWDLLKLKKVIPGSEAFRPLADSKCPLVKKG